jgi:hypothetical protein
MELVWNNTLATGFHPASARLVEGDGIALAKTALEWLWHIPYLYRKAYLAETGCT